MDYQYYRGNPLLKIPKKYWKHVHLLRYVGAGMCLLSIMLPFLMIIHILESTLFLNCLSFVLNFYGVVIWLYGFSLKKARASHKHEGDEFMQAFYESKRNRS